MPYTAELRYTGLGYTKYSVIKYRDIRSRVMRCRLQTRQIRYNEVLLYCIVAVRTTPYN